MKQPFNPNNPALEAPRVGAGTLRGRKLTVPAGARPVTSRIKQQLFDLCWDWLPEAKVLDLFAGSGAYGIEAISRGASSATFVDHDAEAQQALRQNLKACKLETQTELIDIDLFSSSASEQLTALRSDYTMIFVDPPFTIWPSNTSAQSQLWKLLQLCAKRWPGALLVLRIPREVPSALDWQGYSRKIGESAVHFYVL